MLEFRPLAFLSLLLCFLVGQAWSQSDFSIEVVAVTGQPAPGTGQFFSFIQNFGPALNDTGQTAFEAGLSGPGNPSIANSALFRASVGGDLVLIAQTDKPAPDGNGILGVIDVNIAINDFGQVAFEVFLAGTANGSSDNSALLLGDGASPLVQLVREGQSAPNGSAFTEFGEVALNQSGDAAFLAFLSGNSFSFPNQGIFLADPAGNVSELVGTGSATQGSPAMISSFDFRNPSLNDAGQVAFFATLSGNAGGSLDDTGIFLSGGNGPVTAIAREGDPDPNGAGVFVDFPLPPVINNRGEVLFQATVGARGSDVDVVLFLGDGMSPLREISRTGQAAPDGNGEIQSTSIPAFNRAGDVAFVGILTDTSGGQSDNTGVFLSRNDGTLLQIAREGDTTSGGGTLEILSSPVLNDAGQIAFLAEISRASFGNDTGLFVYDESIDLNEIIRTGDALLGSTIVGLQFANSAGSTGFGDSRQLAFEFLLADGREGVAIATFVPEPCGVACIISGLLGALLSGRNNRQVADM